ncbi:hypothetical protein D3C75_1203880 [compost metagenome]
MYSYEELEVWLTAAGYVIEGHFGIHNLYGYIADNDIKQDEAWHQKMTALEYELSGRSPYKDIAIFTHIIARKKSD